MGVANCFFGLYLASNSWQSFMLRGYTYMGVQGIHGYTGYTAVYTVYYYYMKDISIWCKRNLKE